MNASLVKKVVIGGIAFIVIGLALAFGPSMLAGFESTRVDVASNTETYNIITAASGSANHSSITFVRPLLSADAGYVTSITSNVSGQTLSVATGTITTTAANITGHTSGNASAETLTVGYDYGTNQYYTGLGTTLAIGPTLVLLGFIIAVGVVAFMGIRLKMR